MNKKLYMQKKLAVRRSGAENPVNLSKIRSWFADNGITYGFMQLEDVYERRVADVEPERIDTAVFQSAQFYSDGMNAMIDSLVMPTTDRDGAFELPTSGELQPGSENGTPIVTQGYQEITQGYPMWRGMDAFGLNREAFAKITVAEMDKMMMAVQSKDARWMIRRMLASIYTNVSYTFKEKGRTDLTVRGLAVTGDGAIYLNDNGELATADHYTGQAAAIGNTTNPYTANETILRAHPANVGTIIHYIPSGLVATTEALSNFYPLGNDLVDFGSDIYLAKSEVQRFRGFGNKIIGVVGEEKPLVMRQEPETQLQGLQVVPIQVDSNFRKFDFYRKAGFAVRNPIAMAVRKISDASYDIPSGYDARTLAG